ncbi:MAG: homoserine O-acetyltransferase [Kiritimatiellaeota bacterium]|nr:homoserine O-acetyltransferase [Kiritimatiellota bacterium]
MGVIAPQTVQLNLPPEGFRLEKGGVLPEITVAYERCGAITPENDNVIFVCHALTGDAHVAGVRPGETEPDGWWEGMIGPGKGIDTDRYQVICANILGGCKGTTGPSSVNPADGKPYGSAFPKITVGDIVEVHRLFLRQLGVTRLAGVIGGSFGGMQVLEWAVRHAAEIDRVMLVATAASLSSQALAFDIVGRHAIVADPNWDRGDYYVNGSQPHNGLSSARKLAHITYLSQDLMDEKFGRAKRQEWLDADDAFKRKIEDNFGTYFQVESYLQYQGEKFIRRFDANSYLHITLAMDEYDAAERAGSLEAAFAGISSRVLVVSMSGDWLFTPEQSADIVTALVKRQKRVSYCHLETGAGHDAFLTHICDLKRIIAAFLAKPQEIAGGAPPSPHFKEIAARIPQDGRVLDLGCGNGALLNILNAARRATGNGVEIDVEQVIEAIGSGCDVLQEDIDDGLAMIPDDSYDCVVLSETLQTIKRPRDLLRQILRVAGNAVITFPNFAAIGVRAQLLFSGRMPKGKQIPYEWYNTPNIHLFTLKDFLVLCEQEGIVVQDVICKANGISGRALLALGCRNMGAETVTVCIKRSF